MEILERLTECIEFGKANKDTKHPPHLEGKDGASELTLAALQQGISPNDILKSSLMVGMTRIGEKFAAGKAYIPNLLISAKAMYASMEHLKPFFESGEATHKGTLIIGTVAGDLHDIGKNLVKMVMEGDGWKVIDLGVSVSSDKFIEAVKEHNDCIVGLSALLTTTMVNMEGIVKDIKAYNDSIKVFVGGAPLSNDFAVKIGADKYFADPHSLVKYLN